MAALPWKPGRTPLSPAEIGYHKALDLCQAGLTVLEAGHAATELPAVSLLAQKVRDLDLHLQVHVSACPCYL